MSTRSWMRRYLWRFGMWGNGFLEGDLGWAGLRLAVVVLSIGLFVVFGTILEIGLAPLRPYYWIESTVLNRLVPEDLLHFVAVFFTRGAQRYALIPVTFFVTAFLIGARYIQDIYELPQYSSGLQYMAASLFGMMYPRMVVENGKAVVEPGEVNLLEKIGGPGELFISPGNAVLLESLTHPSNVSSEGMHFITRYETIKEVVDLGDQHGQIPLTRAMSKDGIIFTISDIHFRYRVAGSRRQGGITGRTPSAPYSFSPRAIRNLIYNRLRRNAGLDVWNTSVQNAFDGEILNYIRSHRADEIIQAGASKSEAREAIIKQLMSPNLRASFQRLGTELIWFDIGNFSYDDPVVEEEWIKVWAAPWGGEAAVRRAEGDAQRETLSEVARSEAQAETLKSLVLALQESGLGDSLDQNRAKYFLFKVGQVLEAMKKNRGYTPNPNGS